MAQTNTTATLDGLFKEIYADKVEDLIPQSAILRKKVSFKEAESVGNKFHQPVVLTAENGVTYAAAGDGAFTLSNSIAMTTQDAQINGNQHVVRTQFDYESMAKSTTSKKAFVQATEIGIKNMMNSHTKRLEIDYLYGGIGIAKTLSSSNVSATTTTVTLTTGSFAAAIWAGLENSLIAFYTSVPALVGTTFTVSNVNVNARTFLATGTAGDITALDIAIAAGTCDIYFATAFGKSMAGLQTIITNTGTLFNINATTYNLFQGNTYDVVSGSLTLTKIQAAIATAVGRGLMEDVEVFVGPNTFANMISNESALRRYNEDNGKMTNGAKEIEFYGSNGMIKVVPHLFVKNSDAFAVAIPQIRRLGAADITFKTPWQGDQIFIHLQTQAGLELRSYSHQAIFLDKPAQATYIKNIS